MTLDILSYSYRNKTVHTAIHTNRYYINEIIVYLLGEKLMIGPNEDLEFDRSMVQYLDACLNPEDRPNSFVIYEEIKKRVGEISSDYVYQSLLTNGEQYFKYDYHLDGQFTRIQLYVDPQEDAWTQW